MSKLDPITQLLATAAEVYEREVSPILVMAFRSALDGIPEPALADAFQAHLSDPKSGSFFPKPADILRHVRAAATAQASGDFDRLMQGASGNPQLPVSLEARRLFIEATGGATTFDMRRWTYERWDAVRVRYLALIPAGGGKPVDALGHDSRAALEHTP